MAFDSEQFKTATYHLRRALCLARGAENDGLAAHVLGDMTMQAIHLHATRQALVLAEEAVGHAQQAGSPKVIARAHALSARALASAGDASGADAMMIRAARAMGKVSQRDEPPWIQFFSATQLQTEFLYAAGALGRSGEVERLVPAVLVADENMQRRHVLAGSAVASALLHAPGYEEPERAVSILTQVAATAGRLSSPRSRTAVVRARKQLGRFDTLTGVDDLIHQGG